MEAQMPDTTYSYTAPKTGEVTTAAGLAVEAVSGGGTDEDSVASLIDAFCDDITEPQFDAMFLAVMEAIPTAQPDEMSATGWGCADADVRAEAHAERRAFGGVY
jgi:hypothetical protein